MPSSYEDRLVVITGGAGFLGQAVVEHVLEAGGRAVVPVMSDAELSRFRFAGDPRVSTVVGVDLSDSGATDALYAGHASGLWGSIHVAGGFSMGPIEAADGRAFETQLRMNAMTCYNCCRAAVVQMRATGRGGRIVNVAAKPALHHHEGAKMVAYAASKAAVAAITGALSEEVKHDHIWISAVVPSIMDTPANRSAMPNADHSAWPRVEEVAATICFLASPANKVTRGAIVPVYGRS